MRRIGSLVLILTLVVVIFNACKDDSKGVDQTGVEISFTNCVTAGIRVWIDDEYQTFVSTDEPAFLEVPSGSHSLYARSNAINTEDKSYYCWSTSFSVTDGETTFLTLDCTDHLCSDSTLE
jgi:hypothetical protein